MPRQQLGSSLLEMVPPKNVSRVKKAPDDHHFNPEGGEDAEWRSKPNPSSCWPRVRPEQRIRFDMSIR